MRLGEPQTETRDGVTVHAFADLSDKAHTLTLVDDPRTGRHLVVEGRQARAMAQILSDALPAEPIKELVERASETRSPRDVRRLALAHAPRPTAASIGVVVTALRSTDAEHIDAGIDAAVDHPARYEGDLHRLATESTDQRLRLRAEQALAKEGSPDGHPALGTHDARRDRRHRSVQPARERDRVPVQPRHA